ncbi:MAG: hypothetical protein RL685_6379 [Pseudomonadota bacterium]|jgi:small conductance mechanosensitive channel
MPKVTELSTRLIDKLVTWVEALVVMLPNAAAAVGVLLVAALLARQVGKLVRRLLQRVTGNLSISTLLGTLSRVSIVALGVFLALGLLELDKAVTSLLAGVGIAGLALGFAFQDIAANFMSGIIMAIDRPFDVGDLVEIGGHTGRVQSVAIRSSMIETVQGLSVSIPNKEVFQNAIVNYTNTPHRRLDLKVGTAYCDDMEKVRRVVTSAVREVPHRNHEREIELFFEEFGDSSINFSVRIWLEKADELPYREARSEALIAIKKALDAEGLTIPFPIRTLDFGAGAVGGERLDQLRLQIRELSE